MTEEDETKDESKKTRKDKKIIDVLMDDGEWRKRTKLDKGKKGRKTEPGTPYKIEPETEDKTEHEPLPKSEAQPQPREYGSEDFGVESGEEEQPEISSVNKTEDKIRAPQSEETATYLSEIERNVLRAIVMGDSNVNDLVRSTNYPEVIVKGAIERLVSKDFIDRNLNPTEKIRGVSLKRQGPGFTVGRKRRYRLEVIDVAIIVAIILFMVSLFYYMGFWG